jgi:hypothetical protein
MDGCRSELGRGRSVVRTFKVSNDPQFVEKMTDKFDSGKKVSPDARLFPGWCPLASAREDPSILWAGRQAQAGVAAGRPGCAVANRQPHQPHSQPHTERR